ncbi:c-type cytochrome [Microvirga roseola]|uniref:c-type cytochrome n=1 Tax=Microvirga roseola TaxID=2883126 RepID=UPI001E35E725|nr:c-type cytochrome [Microvirga roseola]
MMQCRPQHAGKARTSRAEQARAALASALVSLLAACTGSEEPAQSSNDSFQSFDPQVQRIVGGDPAIGRAIAAAYECGVCHVIPGIRGAHGIVGPPLTDFARRQYIGGIVPNHPTVLVRWVKDAPSIAPNTGMPSFDMTEDEARHVAAYLYTLR